MGQCQKQQDKFLKLYPLMKNCLGNGAGEIFELAFALSLQHCHDLATAQRADMSEKAQSVSMAWRQHFRQTRGAVADRKTPRFAPAPTDPTTLQPMPTNACLTDKVPQLSVPVRRLEIDKQAVGCGQIDGILVVSSGELVLKVGPKCTKTTTVGSLQESQSESAVTCNLEAFCCVVCVGRDSGSRAE